MSRTTKQAPTSKLPQSESLELKRSQVHFADYNPRVINEDAKKTLKRGLRKFGLVGGIVVNKQTGYTVVSGHQRIAAMDDIHKYPDNDYTLRADVVDLDLKQEKELNILLNNPNAQGEWDYDALARLLPDIDYKAAGLTENDLNVIGVDFLARTEGETQIANELSDLLHPIEEQKAAAKAAAAGAKENTEGGEVDNKEDGQTAAPDYSKWDASMDGESRRQHMMGVKRDVAAKAAATVQEMNAYIVLSFDSLKARIAFCRRFGLDETQKFFKGEAFDAMIPDLE